MLAKLTPSYEDAHAEVLDRAHGLNIYGVPLEPTGTRPEADGWKQLIPILWCQCVHDSPSSPCPCDGPIVWLRRSDILRSTADRNGGDGKTVSGFVVDRDATVIVENASSMPVRALIGQGATSTEAPCGCGEPPHAPHDARHDDQPVLQGFAEVGHLHNRFLDMAHAFLSEHPKALGIEVLAKQESLSVSNHGALPIERFIRDLGPQFAVSHQHAEILLGGVDRFFGRLNRLSKTPRNFNNRDWSSFTEFQREILQRQVEILGEGLHADEAERAMHRLIPTIHQRANDREEAIPLLVSTSVGVHSYRYWSDGDNREKWNTVMQSVFTSHEPSMGPGGVIAGTDAIGGAAGALGGCLGCGYVSGGIACGPCAAGGGAVVGGSASLLAAWGCALFDC